MEGQQSEINSIFPESNLRKNLKKDKYKLIQTLNKLEKDLYRKDKVNFSYNGMTKSLKSRGINEDLPKQLNMFGGDRRESRQSEPSPENFSI